MNNFEYLKSMTIEQMSHFLCDTIENLSEDEYYPCDMCPVSDKCTEGRNGWLKWLKEGEHETIHENDN